MDLIDRIPGTHRLGNHKYTLVGRLAEGFVHISDMEFLVAHESVCALTYHSETFLDGLLETAANGHHLTDRLH